jgi:hypothetical protein
MSYVVVCKREQPKRYLFLSVQGKLVPFFSVFSHGWKPYAKVFATQQEAKEIIATMQDTGLLGAMALRAFH